MLHHFERLKKQHHSHVKVSIQNDGQNMLKQQAGGGTLNLPLPKGELARALQIWHELF
jgi:hypothetical protein